MSQTMQSSVLPQTDLRVSQLCLGTADLGSSVNRADAFRLLDAFLDRGGNFLDTAHIYADWQCDILGMSEKTIGAWLASRACRDRISIATKGGHPPLGLPVPRLAPELIGLDLQESLRRLGIDQIDLYWLHRDDPARPVAQILDTLETARQAGRIRWYAASNWSVARLQAAAEYATRQRIPGFVASQIQWSLAKVTPACVGDPTMVEMDATIWRYHRETSLPVLAYSSQANGFFSGKYRRDEPASGRPAVRQRYNSELNWGRLERAGKLARELGCHPNQIALAYLLSQPFPTFPIVGCHTPEQLRDSCAAAEISLTPAQVDYLAG